ncbi:unnamed protein product [Diabrotica balteata]|uniref:Ionotropic glutamate receptor C-terminal domain-containing protein n=1 Tax=Diabrotica balteata TaxID=107213 RepID=A0A9N9X8P6_DIABA|nr:unnamed protein product [Diabrotica balteata]
MTSMHAIRYDQFKLLKELSTRYIACQFETFNSNLTYPIPPEHQLFLLDAACNESEKLLETGKQLNKFDHPYRWLIWGQTDRDQFKQFYFRLDGQIFIIDKTEKGIKGTYRIQSIYKTSNESMEFMENDIGTAAFFTIDRIDIIEYIAPSAPTHIRFLFRAPPLSYVSNVFTLPFDSYVWYGCFGLIPLVFLAVYIIVKWEWYDPVFKETVAETHSNTIMPLRPGFFDVLVMELGAITQQGTDTEPKSVSGRIATVFTFIAFMFLYTAYAANIVAILQSTTESIKTLEDLLHSRISLGVEDIVYAHYYFQIEGILNSRPLTHISANPSPISPAYFLNGWSMESVPEVDLTDINSGKLHQNLQESSRFTAEEPVRKAIYQQKVAPKGQKANFMDIYEGISKVQKGFFAFHVELSSGYKVIADTFQENEKCGLKTIEFMNMLEPWVSIRKRSAYKEVIKVGLRKILEVGVQRRDVNRFYSNKPVCQNKGSNFGSAGLIDCYAAFLIYGIGIVFSIFLMVMEIVVQKRLQKRESSAQSDVYVSPVESYAE